MDEKVFQFVVFKWKWRCLHFLWKVQSCTQFYKFFHLYPNRLWWQGRIGGGSIGVESILLGEKWGNDNRNLLAMPNPRPWSVWVGVFRLRGELKIFLEVSVGVCLPKAKVKRKIILEPKQNIQWWIFKV